MSTNYLLDRLIDLFYLVVRNKKSTFLVGTGLALMLAKSIISMQLNYTFTFGEGGYISGKINTTDMTGLMELSCFILGLMVFLIGVFFIVKEELAVCRKLILVLEMRGLSNVADTPLDGAISPVVVGRKQELLVDVRDLVQGTEYQLGKAVNQINLIPMHIAQLMNGKDRNDVSLYVGGILPVPLLFLAGNILANQSKINWLEWDRAQLKWVSPSSGVNLSDLIPCNYQGASEEVVLAFSISYPVDVSELEASFLGKDVVELSLMQPRVGIVASEQSIQKLIQGFMDCIVMLQARGVKKIHLVLAAPSVLSMRLGSCYAGRNMPELIVYQYQKGNPQHKYPWGVVMPNSEVNEGRLLLTA